MSSLEINDSFGRYVDIQLRMNEVRLRKDANLVLKDFHGLDFGLGATSLEPETKEDYGSPKVQITTTKVAKLQSSAQKSITEEEVKQLTNELIQQSIKEDDGITFGEIAPLGVDSATGIDYSFINDPMTKTEMETYAAALKKKLEIKSGDSSEVRKRKQLQEAVIEKLFAALEKKNIQTKKQHCIYHQDAVFPNCRIYITSQKRIVLIYTKSDASLNPLKKAKSSGTFKTFCIAQDFATDEYFASLSPKSEPNSSKFQNRVNSLISHQSDELLGYVHTKSIPGVVKFVKGCLPFCYTSKRGKWKMRIFIVYADRGSLESSILEGNLSSAEKFSIAKQLTKTLAAFEQNRIAHRDLKPGNIILRSKTSQERESKQRESKEECEVLISDLGSVCKIDAHKSELNKLCGTLNYLPPEFILNFKNNQFWKHDKNKHDAWSLGVTLFELYTSNTTYNWYRSLSNVTVVQEFIVKTLDQSKVPVKIQEVIKGLLTIDAQRRFTAAASNKMLSLIQ